jgi:hypothetical protein
MSSDENNYEISKKDNYLQVGSLHAQAQLHIHNCLQCN